MKDRLVRCWLVGATLGILGCSSSSWQTIRLDEQATVSLPSPYIDSPLLASAKLLSASDAQGYYLVKVSPVASTGQGAQRQPYCQAQLQTLLTQSPGQLQDSAAFTVAGYKGLEFAIRGTRVVGGTRTPAFFRCRCLLVGKKAYSLQFLPRVGESDSLASPKPFFDSFRLNGQASE